MKKQSWRCRIIIAGAGNASPTQIEGEGLAQNMPSATRNAIDATLECGVCRVSVRERPKMRETVVPDVLPLPSPCSSHESGQRGRSLLRALHIILILSIFVPTYEKYRFL